jgi:carboxymethylenebutenolidase
MTTINKGTMLEVWQKHTYAEFVAKDLETALATMTEDTYVFLIPSVTGGKSKGQVRRFYGEDFIPNIPTDLAPTPISQTISEDQIIEEAVYSFTHNIAMPWMLPGLAPTGKHVDVPVVAVVGFRDGLITHEHLYWDQASVLVQLGLLDSSGLPIGGADGARRLLAWSGTGNPG